MEARFKLDGAGMKDLREKVMATRKPADEPKKKKEKPPDKEETTTTLDPPREVAPSPEKEIVE